MLYVDSFPVEFQLRHLLITEPKKIYSLVELITIYHSH